MSIRVRLYRYFFYGWLFRDADSGSEWERAAALRHNRRQSGALPIYMLRWLGAGSVLILLEVLSEAAVESAALSAALAVSIIFAVMFNLITGVVWAFLHFDRQPR